MAAFPVFTKSKAAKSTTILVRRAPRNRMRGILAAGPLRIPCALGRTGITSRKREGDGATPLGSMRLLFAYRRDNRMRGFSPALPVRRIRVSDGWCDDPSHAAYNRPVHLPFGASAESMVRPDRLYDAVVVLDWNIRSRTRGRGSAIFLHIAREGYAPTEGCVAVSPRDMRRLSPFLQVGTRLVVLR